MPAIKEEIETASAIGVGKENIVEINGYSTRYASGTQVPNVGDVSHKPAGIIDRDSNPGNLNPSDVPKDGQIKYENFEDDTDKAPNIRLILYRENALNHSRLLFKAFTITYLHSLLNPIIQLIERLL